MPIATINTAAVIVGAIINMVIGAIWYSPAVFGKNWMASMDKKSMDPPPKLMLNKMYGLAFVGALVMTYILAHFVGYTGSTSLTTGAQTGFWIWLGFVAPVSLGVTMWEGKKPAYWFIVNGYNLLTLLITGALLATWR